MVFLESNFKLPAHRPAPRRAQRYCTQMGQYGLLYAISASLSLAQCQWPAATRRPPLTLALITYITGRQLPSSRACTAVCTAGLKRPWGHPSKQPGGLGHWRLHTRQITCQSAMAQVRRSRVSPDRPTEREGMAWHGMAWPPRQISVARLNPLLPPCARVTAQHTQ